MWPMEVSAKKDEEKEGSNLNSEPVVSTILEIHYYSQFSPLSLPPPVFLPSYSTSTALHPPSNLTRCYKDSWKAYVFGREK